MVSFKFANNLMVFCALLGLAACSEPSDRSHRATPEVVDRVEQKTLGETQVGTTRFFIKNTSGQPLAGAQLLIGWGEGNPFEGNFLQANDLGEVLIPSNWSNLPITVSAPGYIRATYFEQNPGEETFILRPVDSEQRFEISGVTTGFGNLPKDGLADFGMVIPALTRNEVFSFDMDMVVSPFMDRFDVAGQEGEVPSNITFPRQKESYIIPVTLEKERYRMYADGAGVKRVVAVRGQFPFKDVVKQLRNGAQFPQMMNYFSFVSAAIRDLDIQGDKVANLPVNEMSFGNPKSFTAPLAARGQIIVGLSVTEIGGYFIPSDFKRLDPGKAAKLKTSASGKAWLLNVLKREVDFNSINPESRALSVSLLPFEQGLNTQFIPLIEKPKVGFDGWTLKQPATKGKLSPMATYSVLSEVKKSSRGDIRLRNWEVYQSGWSEDLKLPIWPGDSSKAGKFRWEVSYLGNETAEKFKMGPHFLETITHVSYNANDF